MLKDLGAIDEFFRPTARERNYVIDIIFGDNLDNPDKEKIAATWIIKDRLKTDEKIASEYVAKIESGAFKHFGQVIKDYLNKYYK